MAVDVYAGMNPEQRQAVAHLHGPLLVVAGAGSGKTRVITHRIANLVQHDVHPTRILAITFTNKAAGEMKERVRNLIHLETPWITTFHSAGLRMIRQDWAALGFSQAPMVQDADDLERTYRQRIFPELQVDPKQVEHKPVMHCISTWKNSLVDIKALEPANDVEAVAQRAHALWERIQRAEHVVDFDDLLVLPVKLMERDPAAMERWRSRFSHILIDEYQDTNHAQYRLIRALGGHGNVCATGDPDQAIYGWRGAQYENIFRFEGDFPGCAKVILATNYRSTRTIINAAEGVIKNNLNRMDKTIRTDNPQGEPITILAVDDATDESWAIAAKIERLLDSGRRKPSDIAIFYRTNAQSRYLEEGLRRRGLAYRIVGGTRFYDREEVRHILAYLRVLTNPADRTSFLRVANVPARGVGDRTLELLTELCDEEGLAPTAALARPDILERIAVGRAATALRQLARTWGMLLTLPLGDPAATVRGVIELTGLEKHYTSSEDPIRAQERIDNIRETITAAAAFRESYPDQGIPGFLDQVALNAEEDRKSDKGTDRVTLMTLHAAKGLEFPVVFITACEESILPLLRRNQPEEAEHLEEERRLMYVGITRAREELYVSRARCRLLYGQTFRNEPSRFLGEMPAECFTSKDRTTARSDPPGGFSLQRALASGLLRRGDSLVSQGKSADEADDELDDVASPGAKGAATRRRNAQINAEADAPQVLSDDPYRPGDLIIHQVFGRGTVVAMKGPASARTIIIQFANGGRRELAMAFGAGKLAKA